MILWYLIYSQLLMHVWELVPMPWNSAQCERIIIYHTLMHVCVLQTCVYFFHFDASSSIECELIGQMPISASPFSKVFFFIESHDFFFFFFRCLISELGPCTRLYILTWNAETNIEQNQSIVSPLAHTYSTSGGKSFTFFDSACRICKIYLSFQLNSNRNRIEWHIINDW